MLPFPSPGRSLITGYTLVVLAACVLACPRVHAIGMRHDVSEALYLALARNQEPYLKGRAPDFSSVAAIGMPHGDEFEVLGTGVLVASQWLLTAAHVVLAPPGSDLDFEQGLEVRFGNSAEKPSQVLRVIDIATPLPLDELRALQDGSGHSEKEVVHAEFHDLALLFLDAPVEGVEPALCDDTDVNLLNYFICIAGFGDSARGNTVLRPWWSNANLKRAAENVIDRVITHNPLTESDLGGILLFDFDSGQETRNTLNSTSKVWSAIFGKGTSNRVPRSLEGAPYPGDSGGPAFAYLNEKWRVVGVSGYGTGYPPDRRQSAIRYGDILVYTSVQAHAPWIHRIIHSSEGETVPPAAQTAQRGRE